MKPINFKQRIATLDEYFKSREPEVIEQPSARGRIIYSGSPAGLYSQYNTKTERIVSLEEVMQLRIESFRHLMHAVPELESAYAAIKNKQEKREIKKCVKKARTKAIEELDKNVYAIWKIRPTTSTHMVRAIDNEGIDTIFFYNGNPFDSNKELIAAHSKKLSDGGIQYGKKAIRRIIQETPLEYTMTYQEYKSAKGGNFSGMAWLKHPVFSRSVGNTKLMPEYVFSLQMLNILEFYHQGKHSGWVPGEIKPGFGRPNGLGYIGETYYPPSNSTINHCMVVLPKSAEVFNDRTSNTR